MDTLAILSLGLFFACLAIILLVRTHRIRDLTDDQISRMGDCYQATPFHGRSE